MPESKVTPGPGGILSLGADVDPIAFLTDLIDRYGDTIRYQTVFGPVFLFVRPEHVQAINQKEHFRRASLVKMFLGEGLLASDGPYHRSQRQLVQKEFIPNRIAPFAEIIADETERLEKEWLAAAGRETDISVAMNKLTLRIIARALFSEDFTDELARTIYESITHVLTSLSKISWTIFGMPASFSAAGAAMFASAKKSIDEACMDLVRRRAAMPAPQRPRDLLTLLIEARSNGAPLTDQQLRDEMVTMLLGGHETTALALTWAFKLLSEHPAAQARLFREAEDVLGDRAPTLEDLPKLSWSKAIFQEALRLYPPVWFMGRTPLEADSIGGHDVPKGACVLIAPWFTHRHPEFWPAPEKFDPSRFLENADPPIHRAAYVPFAGGRHLCLGMHIAMMEGTMILPHLARRFAVAPIAGQAIRPDPGLTLRPTPTLRATIRLRGGQYDTFRISPEAA